MRTFVIVAFVAACGGRTDLGASVEAGVETEAAPTSPRFKVAYQETIFPTAVSVWHSIDSSTSTFAFPWLGTYTYDGAHMVVVSSDVINLLDGHGAVIRAQPFPSAMHPFAYPRPDGERLLLTASDQTETHIGTLDPDGTYLEIGAGSYDPAIYAPDGKTILLSENSRSGDKFTSTLFTMRDDGAERIDLMTNSTGFYEPSFSFDGKRIAYADSPDGSNPTSIVVLDIASRTTNVVLSKDLIFQPTFTPDGTQIVFVAWHENVSSVRLVDIATGNVTIIADNVGSGYHIETWISVAAE